MSIYKGTQLISGVATPVEAGRNIGQIIQSLLPLTDAGLHLLDGTLISGNGIYKSFVEYISKLDLTASYFTTEADWQQSVTTYGVCGKFVYNASANTVRLPKVTGFVEGTIDPSALGDLVEQFVKLPNITGAFETSDRGHVTTGAFYTTSGATARGDNNGSSGHWINLDASRASSVYSGNGTDTKIQPQSILGYMYIVVATGTKTDIEVDIDNVVTDLNNKVDISNMVEITDIGEPLTGLFMPDYTSGISFAMSTNFTAPANGIINATVNGYGGSDAWYWTINGGVKHYFGGNSGGVYPITLLVSKGDVVNIVGTSDTENSFWFYPCKGDN